MKVKIIRIIHFALKWTAVRHISQIYDNPGIFPGKLLQTHGQKLIGIIDRSDRKPSLCTLMQLSDGEGALFSRHPGSPAHMVKTHGPPESGERPVSCGRKA